jgi:RNA polymerase sigma-70 factor (ECF subfamily)
MSMERPPGNPRRDRRLLRRLARGDRRALAELFDAHAEGLFAHALGLTRRLQSAEDAVQTVFVKLAEMGAELLDFRHPEAYLHRMVRSAALDILRREKRRSAAPLEGDIFSQESADPQRLAEIRLLERRMAALPVEQREAVVLHLYEGYTFRQIGRITGVSTSTAASRYRLALERLRESEKRS